MSKTSLRASIIAAALLLIAGAADAAGLGKLTVLSHLGEPLRAEIDVVAPEKGELETLNARLASPDAYIQSSLPYPPVALGLQMALDKRPTGEAFIKVTTQQPVPEPFIDLLIELNWRGGKIVRAYTALLDPPGLAAAPPAAQAPAAATAAAPPAAKPAPPPAPEVETHMGSEMQLPPPEAPPPADVAAAPAPSAEPTPGEALPPTGEAQPAPAAVPAAPPAEAGMPPKAPTTPKEAGSYTVKYGDTLSKVAKQNKTEDVSLDQMLVLLFRSNPDAFSGKNMNRLKTGKVLTIPDPSEAAGIAQKEARKQVRVQVADFRAYRERLAAAAGAAMPSPEEQATGGKVTGPVTEKATPPAGEPKEVLKLSKGESAGAASAQQRVHSLEEEVAARDRTIRDANERIAKLEKTVRDMQSLLDVKSKPMAELQQKQAAAPPQPAPVPPPPAAKMPPAPPPSASTATATSPPAHPEPAPAAASPPPPPPPATATAPPTTPAPGPMAASGTQPGVAAVQPKPKPKVVAPPPPPASFLDELLEEPTYLMGGGAIIALILGFLGYRFIRGRRAAADFGAEKKTSDIADFAAAPSESIPAAAPARAAGAPAPASEEVDPLAEAEIYLAYGRDGQAEEILKEALQAQPRRPEIHLKLLEIFAKRKDLGAFDTAARELQQITGGAGEIWAQAARLGYQIEPGNTRYAAGKPSADETAAAAAAAAAPAANHTLDIQIDSLEPSPEIGTLTDIDAGFGRRFATSAAATATADRLDLNVSIDDGQQPGTRTDIDLGNLSAAVNATPVDLDLDSLGRPTAGAGTDLNTLATLGVDRTSQTPVMDFDLEQPPAGDDKTQSQMAKVDAVDFDLKLDGTATAGTGASGLDFDVDKIDEGGKPEPVLDLGAPTASMPDLDLSNISLDLGGGGGTQEAEVGGKDDKWYDVQTKFDLAKAYQEMGDKEGAKEILREVLAEGDAEQKAAANKVLETL